ncbi:5196_t:CDS:2 [Funneliformis geosporum]|uniref:5196_t:CDS:1 n=1 Tax=Funneliformis geosporum TaxID=1117311 RepID=A0A9W4ST10_9GLOM|nr:5196_t:CDS:2 [Funneliformis geosporum]
MHQKLSENIDLDSLKSPTSDLVIHYQKKVAKENSSLSADLKDYIKTLMKGIDDETVN